MEEILFPGVLLALVAAHALGPAVADAREEIISEFMVAQKIPEIAEGFDGETEHRADERRTFAEEHAVRDTLVVEALAEDFRRVVVRMCHGGVGGIDDLQPFDAADFSKALFAKDES